MKIFGIVLGGIGISIVASEGWILSYIIIILGIILWLYAKK